MFHNHPERNVSYLCLTQVIGCGNVSRERIMEVYVCTHVYLASALWLKNLILLIFFAVYHTCKLLLEATAPHCRSWAEWPKSAVSINPKYLLLTQGKDQLQHWLSSLWPVKSHFNKSRTISLPRASGRCSFHRFPFRQAELTEISKVFFFQCRKNMITLYYLHCLARLADQWYLSSGIKQQGGHNTADTEGAAWSVTAQIILLKMCFTHCGHFHEATAAVFMPAFRADNRLAFH